MTPHDVLAEELKQREEKKKSKESQTIKGEKLLAVNYTITQHDLQVKIAMAQKWLKKSYEVRVVVHGNGEEAKKKQEKIAHEIELATADLGKQVQKQIKEDDLRFQVVPHKKETVTVHERGNIGQIPRPQTRSIHIQTAL
jgi:translation initiation factor IF-3